MVRSTNDSSNIFIPLLPLAPRQFHGQYVADIAKAIRGRTDDGELHKRSLTTLSEYLSELDKTYQILGVDFSRAQLDILIRTRNAGLPIEFEALGPYLIDYMQHDGVITAANLIPEDAIGLQLAKVARQFFPSARLISLYDEYNIRKGNMHGPDEPPQRFTPRQIRNFRTSLVAMFRDESVIPIDAVDGRDFLLIPESSKVIDAEHLVDLLDARGLIMRRGDEVLFVNDNAENPLYRRVRLRTTQGRWLCEALDAAAFLKPENQSITHLVALPNYMKAQQDKVWEILRTLDIPLGNYHNIFYDPTMAPEDVAAITAEALKVAETLVND